MFDILNDPAQELFGIFVINVGSKIVKSDLSPGHAFVSSGGTNLAKTFIGHRAGIFPDAVIQTLLK